MQYQFTKVFYPCVVRSVSHNYIYRQLILSQIYVWLYYKRQLHCNCKSKNISGNPHYPLTSTNFLHTIVVSTTNFLFTLSLALLVRFVFMIPHHNVVTQKVSRNNICAHSSVSHFSISLPRLIISPYFQLIAAFHFVIHEIEIL